MIKVLHVTQALGGVKTYIFEIIRHLDPNEFELIVVAPPDKEFKKICEEYKVKLIELNIPRQIHLFLDPYCFFKLLSIIRKVKPHLIHVHSAKAGMLGKFSRYFHKRPVVFTPNAFSYLSFVGFKRVLFYSLEFLFKKKVNVLLAVSYSEYDRAIHELRYPKERVSVVLNSITTSDVAIERDYANCRTIGMIGRLTYQKNPLLFLELAREIKKKYPHIKFRLIGAGYHDDLKEQIYKYIQEEDLTNVEIIAWGQYDVRQFYRELDIFVLTSAFEGLPFSILEAMDSKLPCVVTKVDGNKDIIRNGENGFEVNSLDQLISCITDLVESSSLREKIGTNGYNYVRSCHRSDLNIQRTAAAYRQQVLIK